MKAPPPQSQHLVVMSLLGVAGYIGFLLPCRHYKNSKEVDIRQTLLHSKVPEDEKT